MSAGRHPEPVDVAAVEHLLCRFAEMLESVVSTQPVHTRLQALCRATTELVGCDRSIIFLRHGTVLRAEANHGNPPEIAARPSSFSLSTDAPIVQAICERQQVTVIDEAQTSSLLGDSPTAVSRLAVAPMWDGRRRLVGMLTAEHGEHAPLFRRTQRELIAGIAHLASIVIEQTSKDVMSASEQAASDDAAHEETVHSGVLSPSEMELLELLCRGYTNEEAAQLLHRSVRTIESHRGRIMTRLGATTRADLVGAAVDLGIVQFRASPSATNHES